MVKNDEMLEFHYDSNGKISKMDGNTWETNSRDLVASNNKIHNELVKKLTLL